MLTEYNKFIQKNLRNGKMTMREAAKLWNKRKVTIFRFRENELNKNRARVENDSGMEVELEFRKYKVERYKYLKLIDKVFRDGEFSVSLDSLYNGNSPQGTARKVFCELLAEAVKRGYVDYSDHISLFAIGQVKGSYIQLLRMYSRMGFQVYGTNHIGSDIFEDIELSREPVITGSPAVLMGATIRDVLKWCTGRF